MKKIGASKSLRWSVIKLSVMIAAAVSIAMTILAIHFQATILLFACITSASIILYIGIARYQWQEQQGAEAGNSAVQAVSLFTDNREGEIIKWPFHAKRPLSLVEQNLYFRMVEALPGNIVVPRIPFYKFVGISREREHMAWFKRISHMSADFLVCDRDFNVTAVVELVDDCSSIRDEWVNARMEEDRVLSSAGIRVVRWPAAATPSVIEIRKEFGQAEPGGYLTLLAAEA